MIIDFDIINHDELMFFGMLIKSIKMEAAPIRKKGDGLDDINNLDDLDDLDDIENEDNRYLFESNDKETQKLILRNKYINRFRNRLKTGLW